MGYEKKYELSFVILKSQKGWKKKIGKSEKILKNWTGPLNVHVQ